MRFGFSALLVSLALFIGFSAKAQVDPSWLYFKYRTSGQKVPVTDPVLPGDQIVDIRTSIVPNQDYFYLDETKTFSYRQTNGVPTNTYYPMAGFNSTSFTEGNLRRVFYGADQYVQNYRLRFPNGYDPNYPNGYPLILMVHGYGERANCWGSNCYWSNSNFYPQPNNANNNPVVNNGKYNILSTVSANNGTEILVTTDVAHGFSSSGYANQIFISNTIPIPATPATNYNGARTVIAVPSATTFRVKVDYIGNTTGNVESYGALRLLNNDHNMSQGGNSHLQAANRAPAGLFPDDPAMPTNAFPGFLFFPQNLNGWGASQDPYHTIRALLLLIEKYNIDPNRIYIHGLSDGGAGTYIIARSAPWLFSAAAPMSGVNNGSIISNNLYQHISNIPFWVFQGGRMVIHYHQPLSI